MTTIPASVVEYINANSPDPAGVIGCHAAGGQVSYSCCEYNVAVFCENRKFKLNRIITLNDVTIELMPFPEIDGTHYVHIRNMILLKDYDSFAVSSLLTKLKEKKYDMMLKTYGKRKIIESLFLIEAINKNLSKYPLLSSLWLKVSAYYFTEGILAMHGIKSSPIHELDQIRGLDLKGSEFASGINSALDCIGIERAGRSAISRSLKVVKALDRGEVCNDLWLAKSQWLLSQGRFADCYHYIGRVATTYLSSKDEDFLIRNLKPIEILLDLTSDSQSNHKLHKQLVKASRNALKS
jgi:hypothetical protein